MRPTSVDKGCFLAIIIAFCILMVMWAGKYAQPEFERIHSEVVALIRQIIGRGQE